MTRRRTGLSLVEILLGLSITVVLMLAIFQAISASFSSFRINQSSAMVTMRSRTILSRLLDQIRATSAHEPYTAMVKTAFQQSPTPVDDTGFKLADIQPDGSVIIYIYWWDTTNPNNGRLMMRREPGQGSTITPTSNVLLNGVTYFSVRLWSGKSDPTLTTYNVLARAAITLTVQEQAGGLTSGNRLVGANKIPDTVSLSGSSVPRQNAWSGQELSYPITKILQQNH